MMDVILYSYQQVIQNQLKLLLVSSLKIEKNWQDG